MVVSQRLNHAKPVTEPLDVVSAHIWERGPLARKTAELQLLCLPYCAESVFPSTRHPDSIRGYAILGYAGHRLSAVLIDHYRWH